MFVQVFLSWLYWHFGVNGSGPYYGFWSGAGSDIGELSIAGAVLLGIAHQARARNCERHRCWRLGLHTTAAGHRVCRKHHPDPPLTDQAILEAHNAAVEAQA